MNSDISKGTTSFNLTDFSKMLHGMSSKQQLRRRKTNGAFGGVTKDERAVRSIKRRFGR